MALETAWVTEDTAWVVVSATVPTPDATASFNELATPPATCCASSTVLETSSVTAPRSSSARRLALSFLAMVRVPRSGQTGGARARARGCASLFSTVETKRRRLDSGNRRVASEAVSKR